MKLKDHEDGSQHECDLTLLIKWKTKIRDKCFVIQ